LLDFVRLNTLIKERGVTKSYLASKLNRNRVIFSDWARGKSAPSKEALRIIAYALDTTPEYLTGESDDPGHAPEPTPAQRQLLSLAETLTNEELQKTLEYAAFLKGQRGK
jgi:DNA-binding helix-turn-helix protein